MKVQKKLKIFLIVAMLFITALVPAGYLYFKYKETEKKLVEAKTTQTDKNKNTLAELGKLIKLPDGETPVIATVSDREKLANQPFFASAKNGDLVILYSKAKKAILYDPIAKRILDTAPLTVNATGSATGTRSPTTTPVSFIILNGTEKTGLTKTYETELKEKIGAITIAGRENAVKRDYANSILVDIKNNPAKAKEISTKLGIVLAGLPEGEKAPGNADFLIILGSDINI